jgi:hypothetical protein
MHVISSSMHQSDLNNIILGIVTNQHYLQVKDNLKRENVQQKFKEYKMKED